MNVSGQNASNVEPSKTHGQWTAVCSCDLDLDPMTFIHELDLDVSNLN